MKRTPVASDRNVGGKLTHLGGNISRAYFQSVTRPHQILFILFSACLMNSNFRLNCTVLIYWFVSYRNQEVIIEISFETSPQSSALQWLTPEQTSGKKHPYLFSQCQVKRIQNDLLFPTREVEGSRAIGALMDRLMGLTQDSILIYLIL